MIPKAIRDQIQPGITVRVWEKIKDGDKQRLSRFQGLVLARKHGDEPGATFTVRSTVAGVGMEKIYPVHSPMIDKVEITAKPTKKVRRSKLYYVRNLSRKAVRKKLGVSVD